MIFEKLLLLLVGIVILTYGYIRRPFRLQVAMVANDSDVSLGFGTRNSRPNVIVPSKGVQTSSLEKFLMMYTCKVCSERNAQMVSKVAYNHGIVISSCRGCKNRHLIADNLKKLDMAEFGDKIADYLEKKGETVQRLQISEADLEDNYLVDKDGVLTIVPKLAGQPPDNVNIIDLRG